MGTRLTIWCNAQFPESAEAELVAGVREHRLIRPDSLQSLNLASGPTDPNLALADVAFGQPDPDQLLSCPRLRWVHLTTAGYTRYDREDLRAALGGRGTMLTTASHVYDEPCAQHILAMMMSGARQLPAAMDDQRGKRTWPAAALRASSNLLIGQTVLIYGFGTIARRLVELLGPLKMNIIGVRRSPTGDEPVRTVSESEGDSLIGTADHVVNILPAGPSTNLYFDERRLGRMKNGVIFYNVGRGSTVEQTALVHFLRTRQIAAAYLDVTEPEPLPGDHPLWSAPCCYITPHTAGGHAEEFGRLVRHFLGNLGRFESDEPLIDRVI